MPSPEQVLRPTPAKPATVPTVRGGEPTQAARSSNGTVDPVTLWLIGTGEGEAEPGAAGTEQRAADASPADATPADSTPAAASAEDGSGWSWNAETGRWVHGSDSPSGSGGGTQRAEGER
jgi:hypothetical protein